MEGFFSKKQPAIHQRLTKTALVFLIAIRTQQFATGDESESFLLFLTDIRLFILSSMGVTYSFEVENKILNLNIFSIMAIITFW